MHLILKISYSKNNYLNSIMYQEVKKYMKWFLTN